MKSVQVALAALLSFFAADVYASSGLGRQDTVVDCGEGHINDYSVTVTRAQNSGKITATLSHSGVAGVMPIETFDVLERQSGANSVYTDTATDGKDFRLVVTHVSTGQANRLPGSLLVNTQLRQLDLRMGCVLPISVM